MQKKLNTKSTIVDLAVVLFCLAGAFVSGLAFWKEYNRTLVKLNDEPVGTITFKKNTAQRKFSDREIWDRLKQATPIYNGDTIRTVEQSEAIVIFKDEITYLNLDEGTLIQIFFDEREGGRIDFFSGNLEVASGAKSIVITSGDSEIKLEGQASLMKNDEGLGLSVSGGRAGFDGKEIEAGEILTLDSSGKITEIPVIAVTSFGPSARVLGIPAAGTVPVVFSWNTSNFDSDTYVIVEVALDRGFNRMVETRNVTGAVSVSVPLENGLYWWRAYPANAGSREPANRIYPSGTLEVIPVTATTLIFPAPAAEIVYSDISQVPFSWSASENASSYLVEISTGRNMDSPVVSRKVERNSVTQIGLEDGRWFWRVTPVFPGWYIGSVSPSAVSEFFIVKGNPMPAEPVLTFPLNNGTIIFDSGGRRLLWAHDPVAVSWDVEVAENPDMTNPIVKQNVVSNYFSLPPEVLQDGKIWYWRVSAFGSGTGGSVGGLAGSGTNPVISETRNFTVSSGSRPPVETLPAALPPVRETPPTVAEPPPPAPSLPEEPVLQAEEPAVQDRPEQPEPVLAEKQLPAEPPRVEQPSPEPPSLTQLPPEKPPQAQPSPVHTVQLQPIISGNLLRLALPNDRTVSGTVPASNHIYTTGQLANENSITFTWRGRASEYQFALFRNNGQPVIAPVTVSDSSYTLTNPAGVLSEGLYVWQVFEKNRRGNWDLPSSSNILHVRTAKVQESNTED